MKKQPTSTATVTLEADEAKGLTHVRFHVEHPNAAVVAARVRDALADIGALLATNIAQTSAGDRRASARASEPSSYTIAVLWTHWSGE